MIRTSSMGDVIMTLPVLRSFAAAYPGKELVFVTKKPFDQFVTGIPGVKVFLSDHHGRHKGFRGLLRVWKDLRSMYHITAVADLHDVIRSKVVRLLFRMGGCHVASIDKERIRRRKLVRGRLTGSLTHTVERYRKVFERAGYPLELVPGPWMFPSAEERAVAAAQTKQQAHYLRPDDVMQVSHRSDVIHCTKIHPYPQQTTETTVPAVMIRKENLYSGNAGNKLIKRLLGDKDQLFARVCSGKRPEYGQGHYHITHR